MQLSFRLDKRPGMSHLALDGKKKVAEDSQQSKLTCLVPHVSHSGAVHCVPVHHKGQAKCMCQEILSFIAFLGHGEVTIRCDQEHSTLAIQRLVQRARQRLNLKTVIEDAKVGDHGGNAAVEKAIDRVRRQASVFLHALTSKIGFDVQPQHPLFAWAFVHASWTLTRFAVRAGMTPFEVVAGHAYQSKLCAYGCPVMVFVGDTVKQKGDARWQRGIFLTKTWSNDMYLVAVGGTLRVSRSIKMLFPDWSEHMDEFRQVLTFPWQLEGNLGNRTFPIVRGEQPFATMIPGIDDEAADKPDDEVIPPPVIEELVPIPETIRRNMPPPPSAVVSAPASVLPAVPNVAQGDANNTGDAAMAPVPTIEQAGPPVPSLGVPGPVTPGMEVEVTETIDAGEALEPDAKRPRLSTMRVGAETLAHMDVDADEYFQQLEELTTENPKELIDESVHADWDYDNSMREMSENDLWQPFSSLEPMLDAATMERIDLYADQVEVDRLLEMGVITTHDKFTGDLGTQLNAKFVRSWRKKTRKTTDAEGNVIAETQGWLRRSRLVAREYNWLDVRDDVYSPSSNSAIVKLLPALALSNGFNNNCVLGTLDIGDAFLQVNQPMPRVVKLGKSDFIILRCLPGQRDASKLWYNHFVETLKSKFDAEVCTEQPCVLKVKTLAAMVLHVDDVLFMGDEEWIKTTFLPELEKEFRLSSTVVSREHGGHFEFLKRCHVVDAGYTCVTVYPEVKHVCAMFERYSKANGKPPKLAKTPCTPGTPSVNAQLDEPLPQHLAEEFRSLVGIAMYVSQERFDLQFATKTLASSLKEPTRRSWAELGRLVGYMKFNENFALKMKQLQIGTTFQEAMRDVSSQSSSNCVETFSDSDWSGRSTSSAVHVVNGVVVWSTSRSQKCVSLSSTEAEWYAAISGACDGLFLHHVISFLCDGNVKPLVLHTDNSAVRMLSKKLGAGRLRPIRGRLLWLQEKSNGGEIDIKQVSTNYNIADLNTKALNKDRYMCLLFLLVFVCDGEPVGEMEFSRMEAKEMLKHQVKSVRESMADTTPHMPCAQSNKFAKQFLRVLSIWSVLGLADGSMFSSLRAFEVNASKALSWWYGIQSPMVLAMLCGFVFTLALVAYMVPTDEAEPEPEQQSNEAGMEPSTEPQSSRYEVNPRSLGMRFPGVFADATFRAEGMLVWLYFRCQARIRRENNALANAERMNGLSEMIHMFMDHTTDERHNQMKESLIAMTDLTDDERSPRFQFSEQQVMDDIDQAFQGYQVGMSMFGHLRRRPQQVAGSDDDEEQMESQEHRFHRYCQSTMSEVSDPEMWMEINHESEDERYHRYFMCERHEVSDTERWDEQHAEMMVENEEIAQSSHKEESEGEV